MQKAGSKWVQGSALRAWVWASSRIRSIGQVIMKIVGITHWGDTLFFFPRSTAMLFMTISTHAWGAFKAAAHVWGPWRMRYSAWARSQETEASFCRHPHSPPASNLFSSGLGWGTPTRFSVELWQCAEACSRRRVWSPDNWVLFDL